jgi:flagellar capping protein FliD
LFTDTTNGVASKLSGYVDSLVGTSGKLNDKTDKLSKDISAIDTQINDLERIVQSNKESLTQKFINMETAQQQINQQLQVLAQRFGTSAAK